MIKLITTKVYERKLKKFKKQHPDQKQNYQRVITLLCNDPYHPTLKLHRLNGGFQEYHSVSLSFQYRIMVDFIIKENEIILIDIGSHDIYDKK